MVALRERFYGEGRQGLLLNLSTTHNPIHLVPHTLGVILVWLPVSLLLIIFPLVFASFSFLICEPLQRLLYPSFQFWAFHFMLIAILLPPHVLLSSLISSLSPFAPFHSHFLLGLSLHIRLPLFLSSLPHSTRLLRGCMLACVCSGDDAGVARMGKMEREAEGRGGTGAEAGGGGPPVSSGLP